MSEVKDLNKLFENTKEAYLKEKKASEEELQAAIEAGFDALADYLMNKCVLDVNGNEYRIAEIEFYYFDNNKNENEKDKHTDVFTHCNPKQKTSNKFYFHNSGIDITFGNENYYGGILIRGLIRKQKNTFVLGPHKVSTEFLHNANEIDNKLELTITLKVKQQPKNIIVKSCRVGLNINSDNNCKKDFKESPKKIYELKEKYAFKPYRYILNDEELILNLLKSTDSHFLAVFLKNSNFSQKIKNTINNKINYLKSKSFLDTQKEKRKLFLGKFRDKIYS